MKLSKYPAHKLILCFGLTTLIYILLYEFIFTSYPSPNANIYKAGIIFSKICYSVVAASLFYYISQYIPIYRPKHERKIKILFAVHQKTQAINSIVWEIKRHLNIDSTQYKDILFFKQIISNLDLTKPVGGFKNWLEYLPYIKKKLLELIQSITLYNDYLSKEYFQEIIIIERRLIASDTFDNQVRSDFFTPQFEIDFQELFIHNEHLQLLSEAEFKKYQKEFDLDGKIYREKFYKEYDQKGNS